MRDRDFGHVAGAHVPQFLQKRTLPLLQTRICDLTLRRHARAHDVDHDFGRVDKHRSIARWDVGRRGELRGVENDWEDVLRTEGQDEAGQTRWGGRSWRRSIY